MKEVIGILGGTFDPVHKGHLQVAEAARNAFHLERVIFIPAAQPPHKNRCDILPGETRLEMLGLALKEDAGFTANPVELHRQGPSYTIDTLRTLQGQMPSSKLRLIMGADMLPELHLWKDAREVIELGNPIVAVRPGTLESKEEVAENVAPEFHDLVPELQAGFLSMPPCPISSTMIREYRREGKNIEHLVSEAVANYIKDNELYN